MVQGHFRRKNTNFGPIFGGHVRAKTPQSLAKCASSGQNPHLAVRWGNSDGWKPSTVGAGTGTKCPQSYNSDSLTKYTASFWIRTKGHKPETDGPKLGNQKPFQGKKQTRQNEKAAHTARVDSVQEWGHWTPPAPVAPVSEHSGTDFGDFGPFLARFGSRLVWAKIAPFGPVEARWSENAHYGVKEDP